MYWNSKCLSNGVLLRLKHKIKVRSAVTVLGGGRVGGYKTRKHANANLTACCASRCRMENNALSRALSFGSCTPTRVSHGAALGQHSLTSYLTLQFACGPPSVKCLNSSNKVRHTWHRWIGVWLCRRCRLLLRRFSNVRVCRWVCYGVFCRLLLQTMSHVENKNNKRNEECCLPSMRAAIEFATICLHVLATLDLH